MDDKRRRFEAQVLPHLDAAYSFARWLARSAADADDVLQESVLRAFRGFDALRGSDVKAWLFTIVRNCHFSALKDRQRRAHAPLPEEHDPTDGHAMVSMSPDPETAAIHSNEAQTLEQLVGSLPSEYREVLILRELEDLSYRDIAAVANIPIGTVMSRLARARAALKQQWFEKIEGSSRAVP